MKIEYRAAKVGGGAYSVLADESVSTLAARITAFQIPMRKNPQIEPTAASTTGGTLFVNDVGNAQFVLSFGVERVHASPAAALLFLQTEPGVFAGIGNWDVKITVDTQVTYLAAAVLTEFTPNPHSDQSSFCKYSFTGGSYTTTAP